MKIVDVTLGAAPDDRPARNGWAIISFSGEGGGRASIGVRIDHRITSWREAAAQLHSNMGAEALGWPRYVQAKVQGNIIRLLVPDGISKTSFFAEWNPDLDQRGPHELNPAEITIREESFGEG